MEFSIVFDHASNSFLHDTQRSDNVLICDNSTAWHKLMKNAWRYSTKLRVQGPHYRIALGTILDHDVPSMGISQAKSYMTALESTWMQDSSRECVNLSQARRGHTVYVQRHV